MAVIGAGDYHRRRDRQEICLRRLYDLRRPPQRRQAGAAGQGDRGGRRRDPRPLARCAQGGGDHLLPQRRRQARAAGSLHLQHRRQRQFPDPRYHRARVPQGLGDGLLLRLPGRPRGGPADGAARQGQYLLHRRDRVACAAAPAMPPSPAPSSACARWHRRWRANSGRRISMSRTSSSIPASIPNGCGSAASRRWGPNALDDPDLLMPPASVAASYWQLYQQPQTAWTFELEIRPFGEKW